MILHRPHLGRNLNNCWSSDDRGCWEVRWIFNKRAIEQKSLVAYLIGWVIAFIAKAKSELITQAQSQRHTHGAQSKAQTGTTVRDQHCKAQSQYPHATADTLSKPSSYKHSYPPRKQNNKKKRVLQWCFKILKAKLLPFILLYKSPKYMLHRELADLPFSLIFGVNALLGRIFNG